MFHDIANMIDKRPVFGPAVISADQTAAVVDLHGKTGIAIGILVGVGGITFDATNRFEVRFRHSDEAATGFTDVALDDLTGPDKPSAVGTGGIVREYRAAHAAPTAALIGYVGTKRYLEVDIEFHGTHGTGTPIAIVALEKPDLLPPR